ncbi:MAG: hypothetical protein JNM91_10720 [Flavobacteriales bacterium]|nr:hypothetical protein [Flavobacteriales bacterium]
MQFPLLLLDRGDVDMVFDLDEFWRDVDQSFRRKDNEETAIDAFGQEWSWTYQDECNIPDRVVREWDLDRCKELLRRWFSGVRIEKRIQSEIDAATSVKDLFNRLGDFF